MNMMSIFENIKGIKGVKNDEKTTLLERLLLKMTYKNAIMFNHLVNMFFHKSKLKKEVLTDSVSF